MQLAKTSNVRPTQLNYSHYVTTKYDRDIMNAIPFHEEIHAHILAFIKKRFKRNTPAAILDLGAGTALTSALIRSVLPKASFDIVDFSKRMLDGAKRRLGTERVRYYLQDFALLRFPARYDIITTVIGLHHQNNTGAERLINKIYRNLKPGGLFILADLMTSQNKYTAAFNSAMHYHHLVEHAANKQTLTDWAHHHMFLNDLKPVEDHLRWLHAAGFTIVKKYSKLNTVLIIAKK